MSRDGYGALGMDEIRALLDILLGNAQSKKNLQRLRNATPIWVTGRVAVGVCPTNDSFLIWTDLQKPAAKILATPEVIADFYSKVMPLIQQHREIARRLEAAEWENDVNHLLKTVVPTVVAGRVAAVSSSGKPNKSGLTAAHDKATTALSVFARRWNAQPDN